MIFILLLMTAVFGIITVRAFDKNHYFIGSIFWIIAVFFATILWNYTH